MKYYMLMFKEDEDDMAGIDNDENRQKYYEEFGKDDFCEIVGRKDFQFCDCWDVSKKRNLSREHEGSLSESRHWMDPRVHLKYKGVYIQYFNLIDMQDGFIYEKSCSMGLPGFIDDNVLRLLTLEQHKAKINNITS